MPLYLDTPGLRLDEGYYLDQVEDFPLRPGEVATPPPATATPVSYPSLPTRNRKRHMNDRQRAQVNRLLRVKAFCTNNAAAFTHTPPEPGDAKFATTRTALDALLPKITGKQAAQVGGGGGQATANQEKERDELIAVLRRVNGTASAIAGERKTPALMERFRMPPLVDAELVASAEAFATAIEELNLAAAFTEHGWKVNPATRLRAEAEDIGATEQAQANASSVSAGATNALPGLLKEGKVLVTILDNLIKVAFEHDADMLGRWKTASHLQSTGGGGEAPTPTPTPTPTPAPNPAPGS